MGWGNRGKPSFCAGSIRGSQRLVGDVFACCQPVAEFGSGVDVERAVDACDVGLDGFGLQNAAAATSRLVSSDAARRRAIHATPPLRRA